MHYKLSQSLYKALYPALKIKLTKPHGDFTFIDVNYIRNISSLNPEEEHQLDEFFENAYGINIWDVQFILNRISVAELGEYIKGCARNGDDIPSALSELFLHFFNEEDESHEFLSEAEDFDEDFDELDEDDIEVEDGLFPGYVVDNHLLFSLGRGHAISAPQVVSAKKSPVFRAMIDQLGADASTFIVTCCLNRDEDPRPVFLSSAVELRGTSIWWEYAHISDIVESPYCSGGSGVVIVRAFSDNDTVTMTDSQGNQKDFPTKTVGMWIFTPDGHLLGIDRDTACASYDYDSVTGELLVPEEGVGYISTDSIMRDFQLL